MFPNNLMTRTFTFSYPCRAWTLAVRADRYTNGTLAVQLVDQEDGEDFATVSVNLGITGLADDEFVFKTYSENEGLFEAMIEAGLIEKTGRSADVGRAGAQPICRLLCK